ncbi:MAG: SMP-30/gluconolactonase/LRE family protein [Rhodoferax sp.]|nr:SMP-30/gluconolactonase/LRE family protein [Rhodoferax sp.]
MGNVVGEGPAWHPEQQVLYWIDIRAQQLLRLDPATDALTRWDLPEVVGAMALGAGNQIYLALKHRVVSMDLSSGVLTDIAHVELDRPTNRLNDGKTSPSGKWFLFGSMDDRVNKESTGALYCLSTKGDVVRLYDGLVVCNGIAWSADGATLYFSDSFHGVLMRADWSEEKGSMGEPKLHAVLDDANGRPDGGNVDVDGNYWSAGVSAGCINVLSPDGKVIDKVPLPSRAPTMATFGGGDLKTLYITSLVRPQWTEIGPCDGSLLEIHTNTTGRANALFSCAGGLG